jgi:hypothetical protein
LYDSNKEKANYTDKDIIPDPDFTPIKTYSNAFTKRVDTVLDSEGKSGISRWVAQLLENPMLVVQLI